MPTSCSGCGSGEMQLWPYSSKNPVLISGGRLWNTEIPVLLCSCGVANYPDVTPVGIFPVHNKCLISLDFIIEIRNALASGKNYLVSGTMGSLGYCMLSQL